MPKKKPARELTSDEALRRLFPKKVAEKAKEEARKASEKPSTSKDKG